MILHFRFPAGVIREDRCGGLCLEYETVQALMKDLREIDTAPFRQADAAYCVRKRWESG